MGKTGFWQELKHRHVYRVAAAYAVVGWLMILIGFPIALVRAGASDAPRAWSFISSFPGAPQKRTRNPALPLCQPGIKDWIPGSGCAGPGMTMVRVGDA